MSSADDDQLMQSLLTLHAGTKAAEKTSAAPNGHRGCHCSGVVRALGKALRSAILLCR